MKKQLLLFITIFISVTALGYLILTKEKNNKEFFEKSETPIKQEKYEKDMKEALISRPSTNQGEQIKLEEVEESEEIQMKNPDTLTATLLDVTGGTSTGQAHILRENEKIMHIVLAKLPDPEGNNKYEGWLVKKSPTTSFISTGLLQKNDNGEYALVFTDQSSYEDYNFVVITEETVIDETPEVHIIEGLAK